MTAVWELFFLVMKCDYSRINISVFTIVLMVLIFNKHFFWKYYGCLKCNSQITVKYIALLLGEKNENGNIAFSWPFWGGNTIFPYNLENRSRKLD